MKLFGPYSHKKWPMTRELLVYSVKHVFRVISKTHFSYPHTHTAHVCNLNSHEHEHHFVHNFREYDAIAISTAYLICEKTEV